MWDVNRKAHLRYDVAGVLARILSLVTATSLSSSPFLAAAHAERVAAAMPATPSQNQALANLTSFLASYPEQRYVADRKDVAPLREVRPSLHAIDIAAESSKHY